MRTEPNRRVRCTDLPFHEGRSDLDESPIDKLNAQAIEAQVISALRTVYDPEIPVNIYDLGLIYGIDVGVPVHGSAAVTIRMTLTSPNCPVAEKLPLEAESRIQSLEDVSKATVEIVWEPPWTPQRMSDAAKLELGRDESPPPRMPGGGPVTSMTVGRRKPGD